MKILWLCSTSTPEIAKHIGIKSAVNVSWIVNALDALKKQTDCEVGICFPSSFKEIKSGKADGVSYFAFPQDRPDPTVYNPKLEKYFEEILVSFKPDVIHIWGTEYPHTLSMLKACKNTGLIDNAVVSIQGLCHIIEKHYFASLPENVIKRYTFFDLLKRENIKKQRLMHKKRGKFEIEALKLAKHVIGRTDWDEACTKQINLNIKYHFCNETLRESFYNNKWDIEKCEKHSIFVSQGYYPVKGLHFVLEALAILKKKYSDIKLYVGGLDMINRGWKTSSYSKHIKSLIKKHGLEKNVIFTGTLNEEKMCKRYMDSNVFISASSIENSSNSVGEAMLLGMPVITSDAGGIKNLLSHEKEGIVYPCDEEYMIAYYADKIFSDENLAKQLGESARERALKTHDRQHNLNQLIKIYQEIKG